MFRPQIPTNDLPTGIVTPPAAVEPTAIVPHTGHAPTHCFCENRTPAASARPTVQLTPGSLALVVAGGTAVVLVVGAVLVSMLLAVAITAASLAICALVVRSLIASEHKRR
ncbi:SpdD-like protein [Streptomyces sp. NPDC056938]|uniref:SpdD-like protein n=1 Tax=unclassified Streptomyces TaxID=2593676 RepID=UPI00363BAAB3